MNEQMQKLELEAIAYADGKVPANDRYNDIYHSIVRGKFAELIIRECAQVIKDCEKYGCDKPLEFEVMEHFGVEE